VFSKLTVVKVLLQLTSMCFQYAPIIISRLYGNAVSTTELIYWHIRLTLSIIQMKHIITLKLTQV